MMSQEVSEAIVSEVVGDFHDPSIDISSIGRVDLSEKLMQQRDSDVYLKGHAVNSQFDCPSGSTIDILLGVMSFYL